MKQYKHYNFNKNIFLYNLPPLPSVIRKLTKYKKGSRNFYDLFVATLYTKPKSELKWEIDLNLQNFNWRLPNNILFKITNDIKLRWFQYRIIHRILRKNAYLYKIGIANNSNCTFCAEEMRHYAISLGNVDLSNHYGITYLHGLMIPLI